MADKNICLDLDSLVGTETSTTELFHHIVECYGKQLEGFATRRCVNDADAQEVYQEALMAALQYLEQFRGDAALKTWLFKLISSACIKKHRGLKGQAVHQGIDTVPDLTTPQHLDPEIQVHTKRIIDKMISFVETLNSEDQELFRLAEVEQVPLQEIADTFNLGLSAVKSRVSRIRKKIRENL